MRAVTVLVCFAIYAYLICISFTNALENSDPTAPSKTLARSRRQVYQSQMGLRKARQHWVSELSVKHRKVNKARARKVALIQQGRRLKNPPGSGWTSNLRARFPLSPSPPPPAPPAPDTSSPTTSTSTASPTASPTTAAPTPPPTTISPTITDWRIDASTAFVQCVSEPAVCTSLTFGLDFTGTIPTEIALLTGLSSLRFDGSFSMYNGVPMQGYSIAGSDLTGTLPTELGELLALTSLKISGVDLTGTIPTEFGRLTHLRELTFEAINGIGGSIPTELFLLTELTLLRLSNWWGRSKTNLQGSLPSELGLLTNLNRLVLYSMEGLNGNIPTEIGLLTQLHTLLFLAVYHHGGHHLPLSFTGPIPTEMGYLTSLQSLYISRAVDLTGSIPTEIGQLTSLTSLNFVYAGRNNFDVPWIFDANSLSGTIPTELGMLSALQSLSFHGANLTGTIPLEVTQLLSLTSCLDQAGNDWCSPTNSPTAAPTTV
mmetsp:Transcript_18785/g.41103  ORF Transcript_18785/g.41103 Transcript_18785/m.41103 type:complete len:486 (-) Transcript_18785:228-1685(-)|eukprot:CAMPEP_0118925874 /NCGR_PEP_ID=MMETSP1169-20130426/3687_1 /TAXON_ID=36882 /ORGANISM="Pyramimonas obovata, Strain CCMP722" /LENGTH=485 /DNA_ID=CAMNT_0006867295 /DNA_START=348 /DNA_END=1805 /DNA_ORIENTATION=+